jgi:hypothetical protein
VAEDQHHVAQVWLESDPDRVFLVNPGGSIRLDVVAAAMDRMGVPDRLMGRLVNGQMFGVRMLSVAERARRAALRAAMSPIRQMRAH